MKNDAIPSLTIESIDKTIKQKEYGILELKKKISAEGNLMQKDIYFNELYTQEKELSALYQQKLAITGVL